MQFSWDFLLNMLENDDSKLQTKFREHINSNIFKIIKKNKIMASYLPLWPPNFESLPYPRGRWYVQNFFAKMRGKDELKGTRSNLPLGYVFLSTGAKTVWGVVATPLRRTRVTELSWYTNASKWDANCILNED